MPKSLENMAKRLILVANDWWFDEILRYLSHKEQRGKLLANSSEESELVVK
jgi:hypothetical protein